MSFEVRLEDISCRFGTVTLFENLSLTVPGGGELFITGKSGSGKSSLLEVLAGVITPDEGDIFWDGHLLSSVPRVVLAELELRSSIVFQQHALISYLPLFENIALPLRHHKQGSKSEIDAVVSALVDQFHLNRVAWNLPEALSVGQKKLGAFARALAVSPELICMDDPTVGLDEEQKGCFMAVLDELLFDEQVTVIVASQDSEILERSTRPIFNLSKGYE